MKKKSTSKHRKLCKIQISSSINKTYWTATRPFVYALSVTTFTLQRQSGLAVASATATKAKYLLSESLQIQFVNS